MSAPSSSLGSANRALLRLPLLDLLAGSLLGFWPLESTLAGRPLLVSPGSRCSSRRSPPALSTPLDPGPFAACRCSSSSPPVHILLTLANCRRLAMPHLAMSRLVAFLWPFLVTVPKLQVVLSLLRSWISNLLVSVAGVLWERWVVFSGVGAMSERECR